MGNLKEGINGYKHKEPVLMGPLTGDVINTTCECITKIVRLAETVRDGTTESVACIRIISKLLVLLEKQVDDILPAETK